MHSDLKELSIHLNEIPFLGLASDLGGNIKGSGKAPSFLKSILGLKSLRQISPDFFERNNFELISKLNKKLAAETYNHAKMNEFFINIGGDHSCAVGTWSGVAEGYREAGDIGLLWIDAHMDGHTPDTTKSGNIHGMPLAALLGYGNPHLTQILSPKPKLKPQNVALIGIRSYEEEEANFLNELNVRIYFMEEVKRRGLQEIWKEAIQHVSMHTAGYGVSFDLDSLDPSFASAVGTPVANGLNLHEVLNCFELFKDSPILAFELVEYNPDLDLNYLSLEVIRKILNETYLISKSRNSPMEIISR